jgi:hypothetical protein
VVLNPCAHGRGWEDLPFASARKVLKKALAPGRSRWQQGKMPRKQFLLCLASLCFALALWTGLATASERDARVVARPGPWPVVSRLIAFEGRIWFANSVKGRNHNSADIYSYDPKSGETRYELHLFSQDVGKPLVAGRRLYWPFEDSRFNLGWGYFTSGESGTWKIGSIRNPLIFHLHALVEMPDGKILAATSAWRAGLHISDDDGATWRQIYDHPTPEKRVSRIVDLAVAGERAFASVIAPEGRRLLMLEEGRVTEIPGWPRDKRIRALAAADNAVFALLGEGQEVWRSDGQSGAQIGTLPGPAWALASGPRGKLWALGRSDATQVLWQSEDGGKSWRKSAQLEGGLPFDLLITGGAVFVGGEGDDGHGILWQIGDDAKLAGKVRANGKGSKASETPPSGDNESGRDWTMAGKDLEAALLAPENYDDRSILRDLIFELAVASPPPDFFSQYLLLSMPEAKIPLIGGAVTVPRKVLGRWFLLWGMAEAGKGSVPLDILSEPWREPDNPSEKYFAAAPLAFWTLGAIGACDPAQLATLIERLSAENDPLWLTGDLVGTLHALTGQPFAYDRKAWRDWFAASSDPCSQHKS